MTNQKQDSRVSMLGMHFTLLEMTLWNMWNLEQKEIYVTNYRNLFASIQRDLTADAKETIAATIELMNAGIQAEKNARSQN